MVISDSAPNHVATIVTVANLIFAPMLGFALAKLKFAGKGVLMGLVIATLMLPAAATLIPLFVLMGFLVAAASIALAVVLSSRSANSWMPPGMPSLTSMS